MTNKQKKKFLKKTITKSKIIKTYCNKNKIPVKEIKLEKDIQPSDFIGTPNTNPPHTYALAGELQIYDSEGRHLKDYKAIINAEKRDKLFAIVSKGYKLIQHDEVVQAVENSIDALGLKSVNKTAQIDDGGRIRMTTNFPNITVAVNNEIHNMMMFWDNSYNLTTGVRLILGVYSPKGYPLYLDNKLANFYHRHTKGLDLENFRKAIVAGIATFKDNVQKEFSRMIETKLTMEKALNFLDTCIKEEVIAKCYLETLQNELRKMPADEMDSQWILYNLINQVLGERVKSLDTKERHISALNKKLKNLK